MKDIKISNTRDFTNPLAIYPEDITKEQIIKRLKEIIDWKGQCQAKDILEKLCFENNFELSDTDKEDILRIFE